MFDMKFAELVLLGKLIACKSRVRSINIEIVYVLFILFLHHIRLNISFEVLMFIPTEVVLVLLEKVTEKIFIDIVACSEKASADGLLLYE